MKLKLFAFLAFITFTTARLQAQTTEVAKGDLKKYGIATDYMNDGRYSDVDKTMTKLVAKYPWHSKMWDLLVKARYYQYLYAKQNTKTSFTISVTDKDGNKKEGGDSLTDMLAKLLSEMDPAIALKDRAINTCREATLKSYMATYSSVLLRNLTVDTPKDKDVSADAREQYDRAESAFGKGNYENAIKYYKKAIEIEPNFYKARLYLGDAYYMMEDYVKAIKYFREAIETFPNELEPRKYLVDALINSKNYDEGYKEGKEAIAVYPDAVMFDKLETCANGLNRNFDKKWIPRGVFPNVIGQKREGKVKDKLWLPYINAQAKIEEYCDKDGIITKTNTLTTSKYAEVYAWEELLKSAPATAFKEARDMQKAGYLDCYVFISLFHNDIYSQFKDFSTNNRSRISDYLDMLTTK